MDNYNLELLIIGIIEALPNNTGTTFADISHLATGDTNSLRVKPIIQDNIKLLRNSWDKVVKSNGYAVNYTNVEKPSNKELSIIHYNDFDSIGLNVKYLKNVLSEKNIILSIDKYINSTNNIELKNKTLMNFFDYNEVNRRAIIKRIALNIGKALRCDEEYKTSMFSMSKTLS